jgi:hypothetical protein
MGHRLNPKEVRANLEKIIATLQANSVAVLLTATVSFDVDGQAYKQEFDSIYPDLAEKYGPLVPLYPRWHLGKRRAAYRRLAPQCGWRNGDH